MSAPSKAPSCPASPEASRPSVEAQISSPRDGAVKAILVGVGEQIDAKDLLIEFV